MKVLRVLGRDFLPGQLLDPSWQPWSRSHDRRPNLTRVASSLLHLFDLQLFFVCRECGTGDAVHDDAGWQMDLICNPLWTLFDFVRTTSQD